MTREALAALALATVLAACRRPPPPAPPRAAEDAGPAEPPAPTLAPRIGLGDPDHAPFVLREAPPPLESDSPPIAARYAGTITVTPAVLGAFAQGETAKVRVRFHPATRGGTTAGIRVLRVAGFEGVSAGFEPSFQVWNTAYGLGNLAYDVIDLPFKILRARRSTPDAPFTLDLPPAHDAIAEIRVAVSLGAKLGRQQGRVEAEGNFEPMSIPVELTVVRFEDRIAPALAGLDAPEADLRVAKLVPPRGRGKEPEPVNARIPALARADGAWKRWLPAGNGIWDLGAVEWLGPITVDTSKARSHVLSGPRDAPRLFVLNPPSVDVIDVRTRTTIARLVPRPRSSLDQADRVIGASPEGDRVLVGTPWHVELFSLEGGAWKERFIDDPALGSEGRAWIAVDPDLRGVLAGVHPEGTVGGFNAVVRHDLVTGKRTSVPLDAECALWAVGKGLVVGLVNASGGEPPIELRFVHMDDLTVTRVSLPPVGDRITHLVIDDATGDVFGDTYVHGCITVSSITLKQRPCPRMPPEDEKVPGTGITYRLGVDGVHYSR